MAIRAAGDRIKEAIRTGKAEILQLSTDDLNRSIGPEGFAPLHWACHYGQIKVRTCTALYQRYHIHEKRFRAGSAEDY